MRVASCDTVSFPIAVFDNVNPVTVYNSHEKIKKSLAPETLFIFSFLLTLSDLAARKDINV